MHTHRIIDLMNPVEHCPACGALLVSVDTGAVCAHCGFSTESEEPAEGTVLVFRKIGGSGDRDRFWAADDWPEDVFDEVA